MKRDFELARLILQKMEECDYLWYANGPLEIEGYTDEQISYHILILEDAELLTRHSSSTNKGDVPVFIPGRLTWQGHDFLALTQNQNKTIWTKAKETIIKPGGSIAFDLLLEWLKAEAKAKIGIP